MTEDINPSPYSDKKATGEAPVAPVADSPAAAADGPVVWPFILGGLIVVGLVCIIGLVGVLSFFIIIESDGDMVQAVSNGATVEDSPTLESGSDSPTLRGDVLFEETFDTNENGWDTGVLEDEYGRETGSIEDGIYTLQVTAEQPVYIERQLPDRDFDDLVLTVDITPTDSDEHYAYGVTFRQNDDLDSYVVELGNDQTFGVFRFDDEGWTTLQDWTVSEAILPGETNTLTVIAEDSRLAFLVNGQPLTDLHDEALSTGTVGLVVEVFQEGQSATVQFDNLVIRKP